MAGVGLAIAAFGAAPAQANHPGWEGNELRGPFATQTECSQHRMLAAVDISDSRHPLTNCSYVSQGAGGLDAGWYYTVLRMR